MTTTSCKSCLLIFGARASGSISYLPTSAPLLLKTGSLTMALAHLVRFANHYVRPVRPRHAAINQEYVVFLVDPHELDVADRDSLVTILAWHLLALLHAAAAAV